MRSGHKPQAPRCALARFVPATMDVEEVKSSGWHEHQILVVSLADARLGWIERQVIEQIGKKLYGRR